MKKKIWIMFVCVITLVLGFGLCGCGHQKEYDAAKALLEEGSYDEAIAAFEEIIEFSDSEEQIKECKFQKATHLLDNGNYDEAKKVFNEIINYSDSANCVLECDYQKANSLISSKQYDDAITLLEEIKDYKDSTNLINECKYQKALIYYETLDFEKALSLFKEVDSYSDSKQYIDSCEYELSTDGQFMRALSNALVSRWEYQATDDAKKLDEATMLSRSCDKELDFLEGFYDQEFNDSDLASLAQKYIDTIKSAKESLNFYNTNFAKYSTDWSRAYESRTIMLEQFVNDYNLKVTDEYSETLEGILVDAQGAKESAKLRKQVDKILETIQITSAVDEWGLSTYNATIENVSDFSFDYFYVTINVEDASGTIISTATINCPNNWDAGKKASTQVYFYPEIDINSVSFDYSATYQSGGIYG